MIPTGARDGQRLQSTTNAVNDPSMQVRYMAALMHTHNLLDIARHLPPELRERYAKRLGFNQMQVSQEPRGVGFF